MKEGDKKTTSKESLSVNKEPYTEEELNSWVNSHWFKLFKKMANRLLSRPLAVLTLLKSAQQKIISVSYTHLTLPTICSV